MGPTAAWFLKIRGVDVGRLPSPALGPWAPRLLWGRLPAALSLRGRVLRCLIRLRLVSLTRLLLLGRQAVLSTSGKEPERPVLAARVCGGIGPGRPAELSPESRTLTSAPDPGLSPSHRHVCKVINFRHACCSKGLKRRMF